MHPIPIYRAKKIDSDEWVEGSLYEQFDTFYILTTDNPQNWENGWHFSDLVERKEIDPSTIAIHFQNMLDKNGTKIFANLNEDGFGGDEVKWNTSLMNGESRVCLYNGGIRLRDYFLDDNILNEKFASRYCEAIGIHKGKENAN